MVSTKWGLRPKVWPYSLFSHSLLSLVLNAAAMAPSMKKIYFQPIQDELALLQPAIPKAVTAYEKLVTSAVMSGAQIRAMQAGTILRTEADVVDLTGRASCPAFS